MATIADVVAAVRQQQSEAEEAALGVLMDRLGVDEAQRRVQRVYRDGGTAWADVRELHLDGRAVWRLWWELAGEHEWAMRTQWLDAAGEG